MHKLGGKNKYQNNYMLSKFLWVEKNVNWYLLHVHFLQLCSSEP